MVISHIVSEKHRIKRKHNLDEFREKLKKHDGIEISFIPFGTITSIINRKLEEGDGSSIKLDYSIND